MGSIHAGISLGTLILVCLVACCGVMAVVWVWARKIRNAGVVDIFWSFNFPLIALLLYILAPGDPIRKLLICGMVVIAGVRLGSHLAIRVIRHLDVEEGRYQQLRKEWAPHPDSKFFWFFQMQALSNVLFALPFFIVSMNVHPGLSGWEAVGIALWVVAVTGEAIADRQLAGFKKDPANKGKVCAIGLWHYSRHPNYFFEWLIWVAYFIFALGSPWGWLAIISPLLVLYLLLKVTGIPATEEQSLRSKGAAYAAYQQSTSVFIPWPKAKS
jgi:steroid 5-alpha reductase family enzyme